MARLLCQRRREDRDSTREKRVASKTRVGSALGKKKNFFPSLCKWVMNGIFYNKVLS